MAEEKKYTAREAAVAVLAKAQELLNKSELAKSEGSKSKHDSCVEHVKENSPEVKNPHAVCVAEGIEPAKWEKSEKIAEPKAENAESVKSGSSQEADARLQEQKAPADNPKEQVEGNNKEWGTAPETYGFLKLAHFMGHVAQKRKKKLGGM